MVKRRDFLCEKSFQQDIWSPENMYLCSSVNFAAAAHVCNPWWSKRELIKTKYVFDCPPSSSTEPTRSRGRVSGSYLPCWKALRGNQKRMTEWKRPFRQWAQKTCKIGGRRMKEEVEGDRGGGWMQQEVPRRESEGGGRQKKKKSMRKECGELQPSKWPLTWALCASPAPG